MKTKCSVILPLFALVMMAPVVNPAAQTETPTQSFSAVVTGVTSGDIYTIDRKGKEQVVVLYGVQNGPSRVLAKQAKDFAEKKVLNQHVTVRIVGTRPGMTLVEFTLADGSNLGHVMLRNGLLRWDSFTARGDESLKAMEAEARQANAGIWGAPPPEVASDKSTAPVVAPKEVHDGEIAYQRRFRAGYDILEGRSWKDEKGVPVLVLRGNGEKQEGLEGEIEVMVAEENRAILEEQARVAAEQAEAARVAYEEQVRAEQEAIRQQEAQNALMLNQQLMFGGAYVQPSLRLTPSMPY